MLTGHSVPSASLITLRITPVRRFAALVVAEQRALDTEDRDLLTQAIER